MKHHRRIGLVLVLALFAGGAACSDLGYYLQSARGQLRVVAARQPVEELLRDPQTPAPLRERMVLAKDLLAFASNELHLEAHGSYRHYIDLKRPYVVWNVVATPRLSLAAKTWCFPFAGCVPYRGYFDEDDARDFAAGLAAKDLDVDVYGVTAYSTLGWFDDPLMNTFLFEQRGQLAELLFHELAHQKVYVKDHTAFNEAFAVVVAEKGAARWLDTAGSPDELQRWRLVRKRREQFDALFDSTRARLLEAYAAHSPDEEKLRTKEAIFEGFREGYGRLLASWGEEKRGGWLDRGLNNARFAASLTYRELVPSFERLWEQSDGDPVRFYQGVQALADLPKDERMARLTGEVTVPK